ncbi:hypothetical protein [Haloterrigena alkaliphila]|uniref:Uncharacterized protein n=1 Tax=Haloterrigena alkaliphila TaxID=2816475 RepID=A0A8A2VI45_9EURY|nr:hypothetical protein [Haloterrigena alkaliphila]QSW97888.1 hypothetical protein J0X25_10705 [Haloterrigena alkaliphila]
MALELLVDAIFETAFDRRDERTRFQWGCLLAGFGLLLIGTAVSLSRGGPYGFVVAVVGALFVLYGR